MRIHGDIRQCIVFLGHAVDRADADTFVAKATGFFAKFDGCSYLVTARHVAEQLAGAPFDIRANVKDGGSIVITFDETEDPLDAWLMHPDADVDVAAIIFPYSLQTGLDHLAIDPSLLATEEELFRLGVGVGDTCYAIGLFRLLQGRKRNFPVVHRGSIAAMPGDDRIPVRALNGDRKLVRGYLIEANNLQGLSGSPVLVRPTITAIVTRGIRASDDTEWQVSHGPEATVSAPSTDLHLLGIWSGSWDARPDDALALDHGREVRVPVGLGTVAPTSALLELLNLPDAMAVRQMALERWTKATET